MPYRWPVDTDFALWELDVLARDCPVCGHRMHFCDHRNRHIHILDFQLRLLLPDHAGRASTGYLGVAPAIRYGRRADSCGRWPSTREGTRDLIRRERADPETSVVRRAFDLRDSGRRTAPDHQSQGMVHALDAHAAHPEPSAAENLLPYRKAGEPPCQKRALDRRRIMRKARSKKKRPLILADLERHYRETSNF